MIHVDDYLDSPGADPVAKEFLEHARRPAVEKDHDWIAANMPVVTWRGKRYLCSGASRLGDVWLRDPDAAFAFYHHRVDVAELSEWTRAADDDCTDCIRGGDEEGWMPSMERWCDCDRGHRGRMRDADNESGERNG